MTEQITFPMKVDQFNELQTQYVYTHHEKGGRYVIEDSAKAAGKLRTVVDNGLVVYRDTVTDQLYVRQRVDFSQSMLATGYVCDGKGTPLYLDTLSRKAAMAAINWLFWYYEDHVSVSRFLSTQGIARRDTEGERFSLRERIKQLLEK